jgi:hypothetical protein
MAATATATAYTRRILATAERAGLNPTSVGTQRGVLLVDLDGDGVEAPFGTLYVSTRTGKVLRGTLTLGNSRIREARQLTGARQVQAALRELA